MYHLIKKDMLIQKKSLLWSLLLLIFFSITVHSMGTAGLAVSTLAICYLLVHGAGTIAEKNNGDIMLISLPIRKETIVLSKYISIYVFAGYALLVNYILHLAAQWFHIPNFSYPFTWEGAVGAFVAVTFMFSLHFPLNFKIGFMKSRIPNFIVLFAFVFGGSTLVNKLSSGSMGEKPALSFSPPLLVLAALILLSVSFALSLHFYKNREF